MCSCVPHVLFSNLMQPNLSLHFRSLSVPRTRQPDPLLRLPTRSSGARRVLASASRIADSRVEGVAICVSQAARREVDSELRGRSGRHVSGFGAARRQFRR